jgi:hypothetical protein
MLSSPLSPRRQTAGGTATFGLSLGTGRFEVIVADDGSSDDTAEVVARYSGRLNVSYYFQPDEGYRLAAARNLGVRHARAPICVFVDSGVILHSGALDAHLRTHQQASQPVAVIGYVYCFNEDNEDGADILAAIDFGNPDATMASLGAQGKWLDIREEFYTKYGDDFADLPAPGSCTGHATYPLRHRSSSTLACSTNGSAPGSQRTSTSPTGCTAAVCASHCAVRRAQYTCRTLRATRLVLDHHVFAINDVIRDKNLPDCADYLAKRSGRQLFPTTCFRLRARCRRRRAGMALATSGLVIMAGSAGSGTRRQSRRWRRLVGCRPPRTRPGICWCP